MSFSEESVPEARAKATAVAMTTRCKQQVGSRMAAGEDMTSTVLRRRRAACLGNTTSIRSKQPCSSHVGYRYRSFGELKPTRTQPAKTTQCLYNLNSPFCYDWCEHNTP